MRQIATWFGAIHPDLGVSSEYAFKGDQYASVIAAAVGTGRLVTGPQVPSVALYLYYRH